MKYKEFKPNWNTGAGGENSYRSLLKWGNPQHCAEPNEAMYVFFKEKLNMSDGDFLSAVNTGEGEIPKITKGKLNSDIIAEFEGMLGKINVLTDSKSRIQAAYGKSVYDSMRLREGIVENVPDAVLTPVNEEQLVSIMRFCSQYRINIYPCGGRTNTVRGAECYAGGVCIDLKKNFNKVLSFSEVDQTVTVMAGITGPQLEETLNNIGDYFSGISYRYTCGHMPQSFEFSTVGGWIMTRSKGNSATKYGGIEDILVSARYITPKGIIDTATFNKDMPFSSVDEIFLGSKGEYGIIVSATLKVHRFMPDTRRLFSYLFRDFESAVRCVREMAQSENGLPSSLYLCDPSRTDMLMRMNSIVDKGIITPFMRHLSNNSSRCLLLGTIEGDKGYSGMVRRFVYRTASRYGGFNATSLVNKSWEKLFFNNAYINDVMLDYRVVIDRIDFSTGWSKLSEVYIKIKELIESRKDTFVMCAVNHVSAHSCSLQCEYAGRFCDSKEYYDFRNNLIEELNKSGLSPTFNHTCDGAYGASKMRQGLVKTIKKYFDPNNVMQTK